MGGFRKRSLIDNKSRSKRYDRYYLLRNSPIKKIDQGSFAYEKLLETLCLCAKDPENYMVLGGSYELAVLHGLLQDRTVRELISSPSYNKDSFEREYMSVWSGSPKGILFSAKTINELRKVVRAELSADKKSLTNETFFYVVSADMAKDGSANTAVIVYKVSPKEFFFTFKIVNLFRIDTTDYSKVSNILKETVMDYNARLLVYDANGIGAAIRDWINKDSRNENGVYLNGLGIINPPPKSEKDLIKWQPSKTIVYEVKAVGEKANDIHQLFFSRLSNGAITFLIKSAEALNKFAELKNFKQASNRIREKRLRPYFFMDEMEKELRNLETIEVKDGISASFKIKRREKSIQKDFFSAAEYGVYAVNSYLELEYYKKRKNNSRKISARDFVLFN